MNDNADVAQQLIDDHNETAIAKVLREKGRALLYSGYCYYCYERVHSPHIFCDLDCRSDWEREQRMNKIEGRR
jgi:hypothetical protein